jgi:hypothetical protein
LSSMFFFKVVLDSVLEWNLAVKPPDLSDSTKHQSHNSVGSP